MADFRAVAGDMWNELENLREQWEGTERAPFIEHHIATYERLAGLAMPETEPHDCTDCGKSNGDCLALCAVRGRGCCAACYMRDTHGALRKAAI